MREIQLQRIPNQQFTVNIGNSIWELTIKIAKKMMFADVYRDNEPIILGTVIVADNPIIPYKYLSGFGNFAILTNNGELPNWELFGITQHLVYLTPEELGLDRQATD